MFYKLTDQDGYTRRGKKNETQWSEGFTVTKKKKGTHELCSSDVVHAYRNLNLALFLNPIHAGITAPLVWEAEGEEVVSDWGKVGCKSLTTSKKLPLPEWYTDETKRRRTIVAFAILCAEAVLQHYEAKYPDDDRPRKAIQAAREHLKMTFAHAAHAADAAYAAYVAYVAHAAHAADAAAYVAGAAAYAAYVAAHAAHAADAAIDFGALADRAVKSVEEER